MSWSLEIHQRLAAAIEANDIDTFLSLLREHPQQLREEDGTEVWLHSAAFQGRVDFAKALLGFGVGVNEWKFPPGHKLFQPTESALIRSVSAGHVEMTKFLLEAGANVNHTLSDGEVCHPLLVAAQKGHLEIAHLLIEYGAELNGTLNGISAVNEAETYGQTEVAEYLRSLGGV